MSNKVFIIDDDRDMVDSLTMILSSHGYQVDASFTANDAVKRTLDVKPDLIILDVMFPENPSGGFELARKLHENDTTKNIPILMVSAVNERFKLGFSDKDRDDSWLPVAHFIEKPILPDKLINIVKELIG